jgi:membrane-associated phospholipid phosphatase
MDTGPLKTSGLQTRPRSSRRVDSGALQAVLSAANRPGAHALAFGAYLAIMTAGLLAVGAWGYGSLYVLLLATLLWLVQRRVRQPTRRHLAHECLFLLITMNITFQAMAGAVPLLRTHRFDQQLFGLDTRMVGGNLSLRLEPLVNPALTEILSTCYIFFMPLLFFNLVRYLFWQKDLLARFYRGLFTVYGVGFLGYLLVPAIGPHLAFPELFGIPLEGGPITRLNAAMVQNGSNHVDVFPSLHCAVSAYLLGFAYCHRRREFWWLLLPVAGLWFSTIYLRYHYFIDVLCGFALAAASLAVAARRPQTP